MLHIITIDNEPAALEVLQRYAATVPFRPSYSSGGIKLL